MYITKVNVPTSICDVYRTVGEMLYFSGAYKHGSVIWYTASRFTFIVIKS